jgi:hypothetical protein
MQSNHVQRYAFPARNEAMVVLQDAFIYSSLFVVTLVCLGLLALLTCMMLWLWGRWKDSKFIRGQLFALFIVVLSCTAPLTTIPILNSSSQRHMKSLQTALQAATRLRITRSESAAESILLCAGPNILLPNEDSEAVLRELGEFVVEDEALIRQLAATMCALSYERVSADPVGTTCITQIEVWKGDSSTMSFRVIGSDLVDLGFGGSYAAATGDLALHISELDNRSISIRLRAARALTDLGAWLHLYSDFTGGQYPAAASWQERILALMQYSETNLGKPVFLHQRLLGGCRFALNPKCTPVSPGDVVLLFETDVEGQNQSGGPELISADMHAPGGCNVLFNDGTVHFVLKNRVHMLKWE